MAVNKLNILNIATVKQVASNRWSLLLLRSIILGGFVFSILVGFFGTPVGNRNFAIVMVWIAWWGALILIIVPILGRGWCAVCPIPVPGEWIQNGAVLGPHRSFRQKQFRRFPRLFRNIWLQNITFTIMAIFSVVILTRPSVTASLLLGMILLAMGLSLIYERRSFCRYVCPVGGFIGLFSQVAPVELRVIDPQVCKAHSQKTCYQGNDNGYGCPWGVYPGGMDVNTNCGLCMECLRTCEFGNIAINMRPFADDLKTSNKIKLDEAYKIFIMLGSALLYSLVLLGPWGKLKLAAYQVGSTKWLVYAFSFLLITWCLLPGVFSLVTRIAHRISPTQNTLRQTFTTYTRTLLPLGFCAWAGFSLSFIFSSLSYLWPTLSDPFGWGWNLFGTSGLPWTPYLSHLVPALQIVVLVAGFAGSVYLAKKNAVEWNAPKQAWLIVGFSLVYTMVIMGLLVA